MAIPTKVTGNEVTAVEFNELVALAKAVPFNIGEYRGWTANPPTSIQVASTPIAVNGTSYVAGDVFIEYVETSNRINQLLCVALKSFTFSSNKRASGHQGVGDAYMVSRQTGFLKDVIDVMGGAATAVDIVFTGKTINVRSVTFNVNVNSVVAGTPIVPSPTSGIFTIPWLWDSIVSAGDGMRMSDNATLILQPLLINRLNLVTTFDSKTDVEWVAAHALGMGFCYGETVGGDAAGPVVFNGTSIPVPEALPFFTTAPNAGDPVYVLQTRGSLQFSTDKFLDTVPTDGNSIRIGTWQAGDILDVLIS